jgi:hypothetical protein
MKNKAIEEASEQYAKNMFEDGGVSTTKEDFARGAYWRDEHPQPRITEDRMVEIMMKILDGLTYNDHFKLGERGMYKLFATAIIAAMEGKK